MLRTIVHLALFLIVALALPHLAQACPNCKDTLANDPAAAGMVRGYFWSILFMMSMPFLILGTFSAYMYYEVRKARAAREQAAACQREAPASEYVG